VGGGRTPKLKCEGAEESQCGVAGPERGTDGLGSKEKKSLEFLEGLGRNEKGEK